ncbi:MAG: hypothetical protein KTR30_15975 [Saprospiraceae bacterium]|nr:hypothetical protein [Saprospiraceae bacterium]
MRVLKIVALSLAGLIIVGAIGAYFFFKKAFTPDPNYLELTESSGAVPIQWVKSKDSDFAAMYLPIQFEGVPDTFYLQFDTGAPSTLLYKKSMLAIKERYPDQMGFLDSTSTITEQTFALGEMEVYSKQFKLYERGEKPISWDSKRKVKIGTLGADMIDKVPTVMDFDRHQCYFGKDLPDFGQEIKFHDLRFRLRKVLIPAEVAGKKRKLLHDSGSSGFELITNKRNWERLSKEGAEPEEAFKVRSWKRQLTAFNIASDKQIEFEEVTIPLQQVTYIKGTSLLQRLGTQATGLGGMIGNQIFLGKVLMLDCPNRKYALIEYPEP